MWKINQPYRVITGDSTVHDQIVYVPLMKVRVENGVVWIADRWYPPIMNEGYKRSRKTVELSSADFEYAVEVDLVLP